MPEDGNWEHWHGWSSCDKSCDGGKRSRVRFCSNPYPKNGGAACPGDGVEKMKCNIDKCPGKYILLGLILSPLNHPFCIGFLYTLKD